MDKKQDLGISANWRLRFAAIWIGQAFSLTGSALVSFALIWWLIETAGSATTLSIASVLGWLPVIVLGPFAGVLIDRWDRRRTKYLHYRTRITLVPATRSPKRARSAERAIRIAPRM